VSFLRLLRVPRCWRGGVAVPLRLSRRTPTCGQEALSVAVSVGYGRKLRPFGLRALGGTLLPALFFPDKVTDSLPFSDYRLEGGASFIFLSDYWKRVVALVVHDRDLLLPSHASKSQRPWRNEGLESFVLCGFCGGIPHLAFP
jgi:hypothetical protein